MTLTKKFSVFLKHQMYEPGVSQLKCKEKGLHIPKQPRLSVACITLTCRYKQPKENDSVSDRVGNLTGNFRNVIVGMVLMLLLALSGLDLVAQTERRYQEIWPSLDAYYRVSPRLRWYGTVSATKLDASSFADGAIGIFVDYFTFPFVKILHPGRADSLPGKFLWLRGGYQYSATPPSAEDPFKESMFVTEANARFYLPYEMLLTVKNRFDWRINNGVFNGRYRPRLTVERDFRTEYLYFTASVFAEYYVNFGNNPVNRLKTQASAEFRVTKHMNFEVLWNHQYAHEPEIQAVDAFGMTLKIYLSKKKN